MAQKRILITSQPYKQQVDYKVIDLQDDLGTGTGTRIESSLPNEK